MTRPKGGGADNTTTAPDSRSWEDAPAFREILLAYFPAEAAEGFRQAGRHLYEAALDVGLDKIQEHAWVSTQVRALLADLRHTAAVLASLADARKEATLPTPEHALAICCQRWAGELLAFALNIEGVLDAEPE